MTNDRWSDAPFAIDVTARPEHIPWVRAFVAAVAAACGLEPDTVDDVKLAVSELVSHVVETRPGGELRVRLRVVSSRLELAVRPWTTADESSPDLEQWVIVTSLFDSARVDGDCAVFSAPIGMST